MNSSMNSSTISQSNCSIMEYLIQKLESRSRRISKQKSLFSSFASYETILSQKKELLTLFTDLEDDLKQASYAIKALLNENKALSIKSSKDEEMAKKIINDLTQNNNYLIAENENLRMQLNNITSPIEENSTNNCDVNELCNSNLNLNIINKQLTDITEENDNEYPQVSNAKNIMNNMKKNKSRIKDAIKKHFNNEIKVENNSPNSSNDILLRIMNSTDNINILNEKLGSDFMQKVLNNDQDIIRQAEDILNEKDKKIPIRIRNTMKSKSKEKMKRSLSSSFTAPRHNVIREGISFEQSLRDYPSTIKASKKQFVNYTNPYGTYFTNPNKNSKEEVKCLRRSRSNVKPVISNDNDI